MIRSRHRWRRHRAQTKRADRRHHHSNTGRPYPTQLRNRNQAPYTIAHHGMPMGEKVLLGTVIAGAVFMAGVQCAKAHEPSQLPPGAAWFQAGEAPAGWEWKATAWGGQTIELAAHADPIFECWRDATIIEDLTAAGWPGGSLQLRAVGPDGVPSEWSAGRVVTVPEPAETIVLLAGLVGLGGLASVKAKGNRCDADELARACIRHEQGRLRARECGEPRCSL